MKKGFTLVEVVVVISIITILSTVTTIGYKYYINKSKDACASSNGQVIFEAIVWTYEACGNKLDSTALAANIDVLTGIPVSNMIVNNLQKTISMNYVYESKTYKLSANLSNYKVQIEDFEHGRKIYEN
ncbi:prepilin-type N-terminal cleavage/methylation domain-containing protein [Clostridium thermarum]|uniref:prepilin-type N-terminal cleavage/methylation domain-containing protein n=1 Tax=Clostridium thermarum TaxID=1716543 RepID=UPI0013D40718|nr:prepilin-type N-terminal cleavage/methylation domain-containing protein [Clostridium thermarum]